jgi:hypothetical protein
MSDTAQSAAEELSALTEPNIPTPSAAANERVEQTEANRSTPSDPADEPSRRVGSRSSRSGASQLRIHQPEHHSFEHRSTEQAGTEHAVDTRDDSHVAAFAGDGEDLEQLLTARGPEFRRLATEVSIDTWTTALFSGSIELRERLLAQLNSADEAELRRRLRESRPVRLGDIDTACREVLSVWRRIQQKLPFDAISSSPNSPQPAAA